MPLSQEHREMLARVYRATSYFVDGPTGRFTLRVGAASPEVDALTAAHGANVWAYITAYNPASVAAPRERNEARQRELEQAVAVAGYRFYRGEGKGDDGGWEAEPSLLVLGIGADEAAALGWRFGQAAVVVGELGRAARLAWTDRE